jgi:hypothetical protein
MSLNKYVLSGLTTLASLGMASSALADGRNPGSLLLYPEFDNRAGIKTVFTITNTNASEGTWVEFVYIGKYGPEGLVLNCEEFNRTHELTANDTLSVITNLHNPTQAQGFAWAFAKTSSAVGANANNEQVFNHLIGQVLTVDGLEVFEYSTNAVSYSGIGNEGALTDADGDNIRDLNGVEYEQTADELLIPRFFGQGGAYLGQVVLISLSGGSKFIHSIDLLLYNDNEEAFSDSVTFICWDRLLLLQVTAASSNVFLGLTNDNPLEAIGTREYGWIRIDGGVASSTAKSIIDPAVYAVYIEVIGPYAAADLPFENGKQNGHLFPRTVNGDNEE